MSRERKPLSAFGDWLVKLAASRDLTLTALAHKVGVSPGTLRYLVIEPERQPSFETCLRLSSFTGKPVDEILSIAGTPGSQVEIPDPERLKLHVLYDSLSPENRSALLKMAEALQVSR